MADWVGIKKAVNSDIKEPLNVKIENAKNQLKQSVDASKTEIKNAVKETQVFLNNSVNSYGSYIYGLIPRGTIQKTFEKSLGTMDYEGITDSIPLSYAISITGSGGVTDLSFYVRVGPGDSYYTGGPDGRSADASLNIKIKVDDEPYHIFNLLAIHRGANVTSGNANCSIDLKLASAFEEIYQPSADFDTYHDGYDETVAITQNIINKSYLAKTNDLIYHFNKSFDVLLSFDLHKYTSKPGFGNKASFSMKYFLS